MMDEARLWDLMNDGRDRMTFPQKRLWQAIRINPQSWSNTTYGPHTRFWVVALIGHMDSTLPPIELTARLVHFPATS
jgi:hypothetical protein